MDKIRTYKEVTLEIQNEQEKATKSWIGSLIYSYYYSNTITLFNKSTKKAIMDNRYEIELETKISVILSKKLTRVADSAIEDAVSEIDKIFPLKRESFGFYYFDCKKKNHYE